MCTLERRAMVICALVCCVLTSCGTVVGLDAYRESAEGAGDSGLDAYPEELADAGLTATPDSGGTENLIAHLPFDEGKGATARDVTGHGHDAVLPSTSSWSPGLNGSSAATLSSGYIDIASLSGEDFPQSEGTMTFAVKLGEQIGIGDTQIFDSHDPSRNHIYVHSTLVGGANIVEAVLMLASSEGSTTLVCSQTVARGAWLRVAASWNDIQSPLVLRVGDKVCTPAAGTSRFRPDAQHMRLLDGCRECSIDDLRIYGRFMTADEIKARFP